MIPDVDAELLSVTVQGNKHALGMPVRVAAIEDGKKVTPSQTRAYCLFRLVCHARAPSALAALTKNLHSRPCHQLFLLQCSTYIFLHHRIAAFRRSQAVNSAYNASSSPQHFLPQEELLCMRGFPLIWAGENCTRWVAGSEHTLDMQCAGVLWRGSGGQAVQPEPAQPAPVEPCHLRGRAFPVRHRSQPLPGSHQLHRSQVHSQVHSRGQLSDPGMPLLSPSTC